MNYQTNILVADGDHYAHPRLHPEHLIRLIKQKCRMGCPEATQIAYEVSVAAQNPKLSPHAVEILRAFAATLVFLDDEMSEEARQGR